MADYWCTRSDPDVTNVYPQRISIVWVLTYSRSSFRRGDSKSENVFRDAVPGVANDVFYQWIATVGRWLSEIKPLDRARLRKPFPLPIEL